MPIFKEHFQLDWIRFLKLIVIVTKLLMWLIETPDPGQCITGNFVSIEFRHQKYSVRFRPMCAFACHWNKAHIQYISWSMVIRVTGWSEWIQESAKSAWPVQMLNFGIWMALSHLLMSSFRIKVSFQKTLKIFKNLISDTAKKIADFGLRSACYGHLLCVEGMRKVIFKL